MHDDERQIRQLVATWMSATAKGDIDTVLSLMTEDVVFLRPGHPPMIGKAAFAATLAPPPGKTATRFDGRSDIKEVHVAGDHAYLWSHLSVTATPAGGSPITRSGHTLSVFRRDGGTWRLARDANLLS